MKINATHQDIYKLRDTLKDMKDGLNFFNDKGIKKFMDSFQTLEGKMNMPSGYRYEDWRDFCQLLNIELVPRFNSHDALLGVYDV